MKKIIAFCLLLTPFLLRAQGDTIAAGVYAWKEPVGGEHPVSPVLFEGSSADMSLLEMSTHAFARKQILRVTVPSTEEQLLIVASGVLSIRRGTTQTNIESMTTNGRVDTPKVVDWMRHSAPTPLLLSGSVLMMAPGERYVIEGGIGTYYLLRFRSKAPAKDSASFVIDIGKTVFTPNAKGGGRKYFERGTAYSRRFEMHATTLNEGLKSHDPHHHRAAEIIILTRGRAEMQIGDSFYPVGTGDVVYLASNVSHALTNKTAGQCTYFAFQFE